MAQSRNRIVSLHVLAAAALATMLAGSLPLASGEADKLQLLLRLKKDTSYTVKITNKQKISNTIHGEKRHTRRTTIITCVFSVQEVDSAGAAVLRCTYQSASLKQDGPAGKIEYDSTNPPATVPLQAQGIAALVGLDFSVKISPQGRVTAILGADEMTKAIIDRFDLAEGPAKRSLKKTPRQHSGSQTIRQMMENMTALYPDKPVAVGESWSKRFPTSDVIPMVLDTTWTLRGRKGGVATIEARATIKSDPDAPPVQIGSSRFRYDLDGRQEGTLALEEATGWTMEAVIKQTLAGQVKVEGHPDHPQGTSWPLAVDSTIAIESSSK